MALTLASNAITFTDNTALSSGIITAAQLSAGAVTTTIIASGAVTPQKLSQPFTLATAQASTSGTNVNFTGIPPWVRRITVLLNSVSTNGTSNLIIQLGTSSGLQTSGYDGSALVSQSGIVGNASFSTGFLIDATTLAADSRSGVVSINLISNNIWAVTGNVSLRNTARTSCFSGTVGLPGTLTQLRVTTVNGADTFDDGTINISYEG